MKGNPTLPTPLSELAALVKGTLIGDGTIAIQGAKPLVEATVGDISLLENAKYLSAVANSPASALVTGPGLKVGGIPVLQVADPLAAFATLVLFFRGPRV